MKKKQLTEIVGCGYGELYSGESNEYLEDFKEHTDNLDEILLVIERVGLTKEDLLQYKKYFLYDKLLTNWLDANNSRFSVGVHRGVVIRWQRIAGEFYIIIRAICLEMINH